jgi:hypothetical protein
MVSIGLKIHHVDALVVVSCIASLQLRYQGCDILYSSRVVYCTSASKFSSRLPFEGAPGFYFPGEDQGKPPRGWVPIRWPSGSEVQPYTYIITEPGFDLECASERILLHSSCRCHPICSTTTVVPTIAALFTLLFTFDIPLHHGAR